jgi:hypothetical protein
MQNLANITAVEVGVVGSALLILCVAPTMLAWSDAWRRRRVLAKAASEAAAREVAAREAAVPAPSAPTSDEIQQRWDAPTVTVDADVLDAPPALAADAAVFAVPESTPAAAPTEAAPATESTEPAPVEPVNEPPAPVEPQGIQFCLQELRRVRLPNWPPAEVQEDPLRSEVWREAERLAALHEHEIGAAPLTSPHPVHSSCLGSAQADAAGMRLHFLLFPVLWPSTAEQATAEAVFEIEPDGKMRSHVNSLRHPR